MRVLGLTFSGHGAAACLVEDGRIVRAVNLERLVRHKHACAALRGYVPFLQGLEVKAYGAEPQHYFDFYEVFPAMLEYVAGTPRLQDAGLDLVVKTQDSIRPITEFGPGSHFVAEYAAFVDYFAGVPVELALEHHLAHAYQAFLCSPFDKAAILTVDGSGEQLPRLGGDCISNSFAVGWGNRVEVMEEICFPHSLGGLYSTVTRQLGFRENQEGSTMALAAFGSDRFYHGAATDVLLFDDGRYNFLLDPTYKQVHLLHRAAAFCPSRRYEDEITEAHKDLAWGTQHLLEMVLLHAVHGLHRRTGLPNLAIAGGVGLNCVANSRLLAETPFEQVYIMPNAGDRGLAAGCALYGYHQILQGQHRQPPAHDYLGRSYGERDVLTALEAEPGIEFRRSSDITTETAALVAEGAIVGWCQGGAEFGPRALGHRSILADPRSHDSKRRLDDDIKRREWFRPYAPSVLREEASRFFDIDAPSPYMLMAFQTRPEMADRIPGVVHVDGSARVQTVDAEHSPLYHRLISEFGRRTGVPLVLNTSFNGNGDPIVETPTDAVRALRSMRLDALALGGYLVWRPEAPPASLQPETP